MTSASIKPFLLTRNRREKKREKKKMEGGLRKTEQNLTIYTDIYIYISATMANTKDNVIQQEKGLLCILLRTITLCRSR